MIIQLLISIVQGILDIVLGWTQAIVLPFGIEDHIVTGTGYVRFVATLFPPLSLFIEAFLWIVVWKITLRLARIIPWLGKAFETW